MIGESFDKKNFTILIADDSKFMRFTMKKSLEAEGYNVIEAENGSEVLSIFKCKKPDIILLDYMMPELDGVATCAKIRGLPGGNLIPILIITSLEDENYVNLAFEAGATDYISKPINWAVLKKRISRLLYTRFTEKNLNYGEAFALSILDHAVEGVITLNTDGSIKFINPAVEKIFLYNSAELIGKSIKKLIPNLNFRDEKLLNNSTEIVGQRKDNSNLPLALTISKFTIDEKDFYTIVLRDITERKNYEDLIKYHAFYDSLTGLPNRLLLKQRMLKEISSARNTNRIFSIMYLDLDGFKEVNDTLGHDIGDKFLKEAALRFKSCVSSKDTVARIGGDEFLILLPTIDCEEGAYNVANKILKSIKEPIVINSHELSISVSIGIAFYPHHGRTIESLICNADVAMYNAKENGKNNFKIYESLTKK